jgi:hypothetical protein
MQTDNNTDSIGKARWDPSKQNAFVLKSKGKYISTMGFASDGQRLLPEEAIFLADREEIELVLSKVVREEAEAEHIMTKFEVFSLLDECNIDMKAYLVYAALREQRFHVYRHGAWKVENKLWSELRTPKVVRTPLLKPYAAEAQPNVGISLTCNESNDEVKAQSKRQKQTFQELETEVFISFDVYKPQAGFSKNRMGKPDFSIIILSCEGRMPSVASLRSTLQHSDPSIPLRLGIVGDSSLTFVEVSDFQPESKTEQVDVK